MTKEKDSSRIHKVLTIVGTVLCIILIPILIINIVLITKSFTNEEEVPNIGGITPLIVLTDSMVPEIYSGDLIITDVEEAKNIKVNDVISFFDPAGNGTSVVTHRVVEIIEENGKLSFRTRGDNNNTDDKMLVPESKLIGVYKMRIPGAGNVALFMQSTAGFIICVVLPIILLVGYDIIRRKIYDKKKKVDTDALLLELEALKAEKAQKEAAVSEGEEQANSTDDSIEAEIEIEVDSDNN